MGHRIESLDCENDITHEETKPRSLGSWEARKEKEQVFAECYSVLGCESYKTISGYVDTLSTGE
jgi:hypothetical protein